jgi:hypothetical protein
MAQQWLIIECLFGDAKTRGLSLEDTRLTDPRKLDLLMAMVALALVWAGRTAVTLLGNRAPKRKAHGHFAKPIFRTGFDDLRRRLRADPITAIIPRRRLEPIPPKIARVVECGPAAFQSGFFQPFQRAESRPSRAGRSGGFRVRPLTPHHRPHRQRAVAE